MAAICAAMSSRPANAVGTNSETGCWLRQCCMATASVMLMPAAVAKAFQASRRMPAANSSTCAASSRSSVFSFMVGPRGFGEWNCHSSTGAPATLAATGA